jgi:hypothetical protein
VKTSRSPDRFELVLNADELTIIHNALNEICNGLPIDDFENRIGLPIEQAEKLFDRVKLLGKTEH